MRIVIDTTDAQDAILRPAARKALRVAGDPTGDQVRALITAKLAARLPDVIREIDAEREAEEARTANEAINVGRQAREAAIAAAWPAPADDAKPA